MADKADKKIEKIRAYLRSVIGSVEVNLGYPFEPDEDEIKAEMAKDILKMLDE